MADLPTYPHPASGQVGSDFAATLETWLSGQDRPDASSGSMGNLQTLEERIEASNRATVGDGVFPDTYTAPLITPGAGLSANFGPFLAMLGIVVDHTAGVSSVGGLTPSATNTLWLRQDGSFAANTTGADPGTARNPAMLMGTAVTSATAVTACTDGFRLLPINAGGGSAGTGTVTSVAVSLPGEFTLSGSPITTSGTIAAAWAPEAPKLILAGPVSGPDAAPAFRALQVSDLPAATGTVSSVGLTLPGEFVVTGSPVTGAGALAGAWAAQAQKTFLAGPASGANAAPSFRALQITDLPALPAASNTVGATLVVAASNSLAPARADAAYRCDGTADDVEVQAALNALAATGGRVVLLEGTYNFSAMVSVLGSNVTLEGQGPGTVIRRGYNEPSAARALLRVGDNVTPLSSVAVRHLAFDGLKATYTTAGFNACIQCFLTTDLHVEGITAKNSTGYAVGISAGVKRAFVSNIHASGTDYQAVGLTSCNDVTVQNVFATDCVGAVYGTGVNGLHVKNVFDSANRTGSATVWLNACNRFAVGGVHSDTSQAQGIQLVSCTRFTLADCVIQAPALAGVFLNACTQFAASNCFIQSPGGYGLYALNGTQFSLSGVNVKAAGNHGVWLSGATDAALTNCTAVGNLAGTGFALNGTNLAVSGCDASGGVGVGFTIGPLSESTVIGCVARSNAGDGMNLSGACSRITVDGCTMTGNTGFGLNILANYEVTVGSNTYGSNTAGDVREWGTLTAAAPNRFLGHGGSCIKVTANATLTGKESFVEVDAAAGAVSITLPTAGTNAQRNWRVTVKKVDSSANAVTIVNLTDGVANRTLTAQFDSLSMVQDGLGYFLERPALTGGSGGAVVEGNTLVVAASDSIGPTRADSSYRCTGTADQTIINNAITALGAKGGTVRLLEGTYTLAGAVVIARSNVTLAGQGAGTVLKRGFNSGSAGRGAVEMGDGATNYSGIVVRDLQIDGQKATWTSTNNAGLSILGQLSDCDIERVTVRNSAGYNYFSNTANARMSMSACRSSGAGNFGFIVQWNQSEVRGCSSNGDTGGFSINGGDSSRYMGLQVNNSATTEGIYAFGAFRMVLQGSTVNTTTGYGIHLQGCTYAMLDGNMATGCAVHGIWIHNGADTDLTGNISTNNTGHGCWCTGSARTSFQGNHFLNSGQNGLNIFNGSTETMLGPNTFAANTGADIVDDGTLAAVNQTRWLGQGGAVYSRTAAYTLTGKESTVECDATSAAFALALPAAAVGLRNWRLLVKKVDSSANAVTVTGTVDGTTNPTLTAQWSRCIIVCNGAAYRFEAGPGAP